jgi:hypothetical protein
MLFHVCKSQKEDEMFAWRQSPLPARQAAASPSKDDDYRNSAAVGSAFALGSTWHFRMQVLASTSFSTEAG